MSKIIVTGGAGFIGSHLVERLVELGHKVLVIDNLSTGKLNNLNKIKNKINFLEYDIVDWILGHERDDNVRKDIDYFYHIAALPRVGRALENPIETHRANVTGTLCALELARKMKVKKFIYSSSSSVYGEQETLPLHEDMVPNPQNPYAYQKWLGEIYCRMYYEVYGLRTTIFRLFNVYGPRMSFEGAYKLVFANWIEQIRTSKPLTIYGDGEQTRDFTHVSDIIDGLVKGGIESIPMTYMPIYNLGAGRQVSVNKLASLFEHEVVHVEARAFEERFKEADIEKAWVDFRWIPLVSIEEGVKQLREYYAI